MSVKPAHMGYDSTKCRVSDQLVRSRGLFCCFMSQQHLRSYRDGYRLVLVALYKNGQKDETLRRFYEEMACSAAAVEPHALPTTPAAAKYQGFRVYHQVQI